MTAVAPEVPPAGGRMPAAPPVIGHDREVGRAIRPGHPAATLTRRRDNADTPDGQAFLHTLVSARHETNAREGHDPLLVVAAGHTRFPSFASAGGPEPQPRTPARASYTDWTNGRDGSLTSWLYPVRLDRADARDRDVILRYSRGASAVPLRRGVRHRFRVPPARARAAGRRRPGSAGSVLRHRPMREHTGSADAAGTPSVPAPDPARRARRPTRQRPRQLVRGKHPTARVQPRRAGRPAGGAVPRAGTRRHRRGGGLPGRAVGHS